MNKKLLRKKLALMLANLKKKRPFYTEVEYLESTGTQWIDTGFIPTENTRTVAGLYTTSTANKNWFGSNGDSQVTKGCYCFNAFSATQIEYLFGNVRWARADAAVVNKVFTVDFSKNGIYIDGELVATPSYTDFGTGDRTMTLFVRNGGTAYISGRIYYLKMYDNGVLIRDFIPVLDWNMKPCMYDKVSEELFYNKLTDDFVAGREIHQVEYLETDGTSYINTGYTPSGSTETEITTMLKNQNTSRFMFGCRTANGQDIYACLSHTSNRIGYRVGTGGYLYSSGYDELNTKHTYKIANGVFYRDDEVINTTCEGATTSPNSPLALLTVNTNNILDYAQTFVGNFYSCTVKNNNVLVRDFIPAIDENDMFFMFDKVSHSCYNNAGSGSFIGPTVQKDENGKIIENEYE